MILRMADDRQLMQGIKQLMETLFDTKDTNLEPLLMYKIECYILS